MSWIKRALVVEVLVAGTWGHAHAAVYAPQNVTVPAYWDPSQNDFNVLGAWDSYNSNQGLKSIVINLGCAANGGWDPATGKCTAAPGSSKVIEGGPGSLSDPNFQTARQQMAGTIFGFQQHGVMVYGYVDFYAGRPPQDIEADIDEWTSQYQQDWGINVNGIFFDEADRADDMYIQGVLAKAEAFTDYANQRSWANGGVVFNYGATGSATETLVSCLATYPNAGGRAPFNYFVTHETWEQTYLTMDPTTDFEVGQPSHWMIGYMPAHFINIVHNVPPDVTADTVTSLITKSRNYNAGQIFLTNFMYCPADAPDPNCTTVCPQGAPNPNFLCNPYNGLTQNSVMDQGTPSPIYDWLYNASEDATMNQNAYYPYGGASDPAEGPCATPNEYAQETSG